MARLYRRVTDSSGFHEPRVLARVFPEHGHFEHTVRFYEHLTGSALDMDLDVREAGLHIVAVGSFLILDLDPTLLDRGKQARQTPVTMIFANLDDAISVSVAAGAEIVAAPFAAPTGRGARVRHADGLLVEYLEHRPSPDDVERPSL
jgi:predicted enzyme related to lactoylglutathione lyase